MFVKILSGKYGEGWKPGDVVAMDYQAARVRLENGEMIEVEATEPRTATTKEDVERVIPKNPAASPKEVDEKTCSDCGYVAKNKNGLRLHKKKHLAK